MSNFDEVFRATRQDVFALTLRMTRDRAEAEDVTQQTFLEVYRSLSQFRGDSQPKTWVFRIAIRLAVKARARGRALASLQEAPAVSVHGEEAVLAKLDAERVTSAMQRLSIEHRAVLALFAIDGLRHQQIAEVLGVAEGTVWSRLHAARKALKALLDQPPTRHRAP